MADPASRVKVFLSIEGKGEMQVIMPAEAANALWDDFGQHRWHVPEEFPKWVGEGAHAKVCADVKEEAEHLAYLESLKPKEEAAPVPDEPR